MPLTNRSYNNDLVAPVIFDIRNDCTKSQWKIGDKDLVGDMLDMIVLRYETGVGAIPPIKTYDQLVKEFKRNSKPVPNLNDTETIRNFLVDRQQVWCYIWFIPVFTTGSKLDEMAKAGKVPSDCVWGTFIKSRSLDGNRTTGFWKYCDQVAGMKRDLIDVISCPRFTVTHQQGGSGQDCHGLEWSVREASCDAERDRLATAKTWVNNLVSDGRVDSVLRLPDIAREQFMVLEDDAVRSLNPADVHELKQQLLMSSLGQSQFGTEIDIYQLAATPVAALRSADVDGNAQSQAQVQTVPIQTLQAVAVETVETVDVEATGSDELVTATTSTRRRVAAVG